MVWDFFKCTYPPHVRLVLFCLVCLARHLIFVVENPSASLLPHHPRWSWFQNRHCWETCQVQSLKLQINNNGIHVFLNAHHQIYIITSEVWRQNFWLGLFSGAASPKPLMALSNSPLVQGLNLGAMTNETNYMCLR